MTHNIMTMTDKQIERTLRFGDHVTNGTDTGRYFGTTKRGVHVVAWGDKRHDVKACQALVDYLNANQ